MKRFVDEVERRLVEAARGISAAHAEAKRRYHGSEHPHLGLSVPQQWEAFKRGYSFSHLSPLEQVPIWEAVWFEGRHHETKEQAIFFVSNLSDKETLAAMWPALVRWSKKARNWPSSDGFSSAFARILEHKRGLVYPMLRRWNGSGDPWERRRSIVSLLYYSGSRKRYPTPAQIFPLVEKLIDDEDRFVQKGIGWTLREAGNVYPKETAAFILKHCGRLSAVAFGEGTRKMGAKVRGKLVAARQAERQRKRGYNKSNGNRVGPTAGGSSGVRQHRAG
ncbi:MAG TPA: DNA alkylation repair protein [Tepidisphaeraceae bacterium]|nr:DNA alkylation repair protein [Tepidisphaeraceae bacterium]